MQACARKPRNISCAVRNYLLRGIMMVPWTSTRRSFLFPPQKPLKDEALFNMGLVYAHFGNPKRNYEKSLNLFLKILNDYPESHLLEQAKIWVGVLLENLETTKKFEKLKETIKDKEERKETFKEAEKTKQQETRFEEYEEGREHLIRSQKLLAQGNYEGAIAENHKVLSLSDPQIPERRGPF